MRFDVLKQGKEKLKSLEDKSQLEAIRHMFHVDKLFGGTP